MAARTDPPAPARPEMRAVGDAAATVADAELPAAAAAAEVDAADAAEAEGVSLSDACDRVSVRRATATSAGMAATAFPIAVPILLLLMC